MKKTIVSFFALLFLIFVPTVMYLMEYSTPVRATQTNIVYNLPYPGILPDNPLYVFKIIRDRLLELGTRDNIKKAQLYLLFSDKRIAMALALSRKGKDMQAVDTAAKAEKYFQKIPSLLITAKKQGSGSSSEFVDGLKLSNAKHREILDTFLKELPQGSNDAINAVIKINKDVQKALSTL